MKEKKVTCSSANLQRTRACGGGRGGVEKNFDVSPGWRRGIDRRGEVRQGGVGVCAESPMARAQQHFLHFLRMLLGKSASRACIDSLQGVSG